MGEVVGGGEVVRGGEEVGEVVGGGVPNFPALSP